MGHSEFNETTFLMKKKTQIVRKYQIDKMSVCFDVHTHLPYLKGLSGLISEMCVNLCARVQLSYTAECTVFSSLKNQVWCKNLFSMLREI